MTEFEKDLRNINLFKMFTEITEETFTDIFNNHIIDQLSQIDCAKNGLFIDVCIDKENMFGYIQTADNKFYKFLPKKVSVLDTIANFFKVNKENVLLTTYLCEKGRKIKSVSKIKSWTWKMVLDNLVWVKLSFMYYQNVL